MDQREHYEDINALVAAIAKGLGIEAEAAARGLEDGTITIAMGEDGDGNRFIEATRAGVSARVFQGAIQYAPGVEPPTAPPAS